MSSGSSSRPPRRDRPSPPVGRPPVVDRQPASRRVRGRVRRAAGPTRGRIDDRVAVRTAGEVEGVPTVDRELGVTDAQPVRRPRPNGVRSRSSPVGCPREPRDPELERQRIEERTTEQWIDEGSVRRAATRRDPDEPRARPAPSAPRRRAPKPLDPEVSAELVEALGPQRARATVGTPRPGVRGPRSRTLPGVPTHRHRDRQGGTEGGLGP